MYNRNLPPRRLLPTPRYPSACQTSGHNAAATRSAEAGKTFGVDRIAETLDDFRYKRFSPADRRRPPPCFALCFQSLQQPLSAKF